MPGIALWFKSPSISYRKNSTPSTLPADNLVGDDLLVEDDLFVGDDLLVGDDILAPDFVGVPLLFFDAVLLADGVFLIGECGGSLPTGLVALSQAVNHYITIKRNIVVIPPNSKQCQAHKDARIQSLVPRV